MALIDELKEQREGYAVRKERALMDVAYFDGKLADLNIAISALCGGAELALEAPAQPVHPDAELRSVPGAEEESRDQFEASAGQTEEAAVRAFSAGDDQSDGVRALPGGVEESRDHILQTIATLNALDNPDHVECATDEPEIPDALAEFMKLPGAVKWGGGVYGDFVKQNPDLNYTETEIEVLLSDGRTLTGLSGGFLWNHTFEPDDIIAYRILEAPASEQFTASDFDTITIPGDPSLTQDVIDALIEAPEQAEPATDLWQQGYNDKLNGYEPSLAEPEYTKGYEARALIEREHSETMERAKFFEGGMMADADRHQSDQRSIVEKIGGLFKREKEDA